MNKRKLLKIIAVVMTCAGLSAVAFSGCKHSDGSGNVDDLPTPDGHRHNYTYTDNGDGTHRGVCNVEGCEVTVEHIPHVDTAGGGPNGKCDYCGADLGEKPAPKVEKITVSGNTESKVSVPVKLTATVEGEEGADKSVRWSVESGLALVDPQGNVYALDAGTVVVRATSKANADVYDDHEIEFTADETEVPSGVNAVVISGDAEVKVNENLTLTATVLPLSITERGVVWTVENGTGSATITDAGVLTGKTAGTVTVKATAKADDSKYAELVVTVKAAGSETPDNPDPDNPNPDNPNPDNPDPENPNPDNPNPDNPDPDNPNPDNPDTPDTSVEVTSVEITCADSVKVGEQISLSATVTPADATVKTVKWSITEGTENAELAANGTLTGKKAGTVTVKVTTDSGNKTDTKTITVESTETKPPEIPTAPEGAPEIYKAEGGLEAGYLEWRAAKGAAWYNVYVMPKGGSSYTKLDDELVRQYSGYFRADAVGLKAGEYTMKVVPTATGGAETTELSATASFTVLAHERSGYAFVGGTSSGAYNDDGTLKENAEVLYVTNDNYSTVSVTYNDRTVTGIDNILGEGYQAKNGATKPLCVRIIGSIGSGSKLDFKASGDLELKGLDQGVTVEGIGNDATANGWGFHITACSNVEIRNLGVMNMMGGTKDGIGLEGGCHHVWVHNCDIFYGNNWGGDQKKGDGSLDTKKSTNVTHSYNHFWDTGKCNLQGMNEKGDFRITYHHNWYDHSDSRHPRIRTATVHIYNNYFDGNAKYGVGATMDSDVFVENNYFRSTAKMMPMLIATQAHDFKSDGSSILSGETGGMIKAFGNIFDCSTSNLTLIERTKDSPESLTEFDCYTAATRDEKVPSSVKALNGGATYNNFDTASDMYKYTVQSAEAAKETVTKYAGRVEGGDFKWTFDNATEDGNSEIIPELSAALKAYRGTLVKVGGAN